MADEDLDHVTHFRDRLWHSMVIDIRRRLLEEEATGVLSQSNLEGILELENESILTSKNGYLSVWLVPETGDGSWNQISPIEQCEPWFMWPNGDVEISGNLFDISNAAQWFVNRLTVV